MDIQNQIRNVVSSMISTENGQHGALSEADVMNQLRQKGVVDEIMRHIQVGGSQNEKPASHFTDATDHLHNPLAKKGL